MILRPTTAVLAQVALILFTVADTVLVRRWTLWCATVAGGLFVLLRINRAPAGPKRMCAILVLVTLALLLFIEQPLLAIERGLRIGCLISGLILSISLLSRAAQRVPLLREIVHGLVLLPQRQLALVTGSQLFGGFLGLAGITMMMEVLSQVPMETEDRVESFSAISRGFAAANLWSPMYSNVSILLALCPGLDWHTVFPLALVLAFASLALSLLLTRLATGNSPRPGQDELASPGWRLWLELGRRSWPIVLCMVLFLAGVLLTSSLLHVPVAAVIMCAAVLVALVLNLRNGAKGSRIRGAVRHVNQGLTQLQVLVGEVMLFLVSGCAGTVIASAIPISYTTWIAEHLATVPVLACLFLGSAVVLLSCTSVHPMLSSIVVASGFTASLMGLPPTAHMLSVLTGLGLAVILTPFSAVSLMASRFSGIPVLTISLRSHLGFALVALLLASLILGGASGHAFAM